ncbi:4-aminobutyrate--2-oxoglutarate transaminase [Pseudomonas sp. MMS21-TM103]|uniref:4-aminobutyrate--2-oxoglutarate transaminase n=1 Tax=Pseudomonas sp. MMS21 TM103 TaxID=2886506 RepID=UPI001EDD8B4A|nr:4-aminobutyrate--2-oxoglutarate transaminase [Pseudomonas sp. MMS21 TM103]MCG4454401.1 4-aminobutyrate--2-oxoglutarate transaminase [Pseudomonas sp. MMS21 TM103]
MNSKVEETPYLLQQRDQFVPRGLVTAHPLVVDRAQGAELWDVDGRRYLDFVGGIGVMNIGHNHPKVVAAVQAQMQKVTHACFQVVAYQPYLDLVQRLCELVAGSSGVAHKAALFTSGAEAVENAVKIARAHTQRPAVISFRGGFHGRTLLGTTLTGMSQPYKQNFGMAPEVFHTPYPNAYRGFTSEMALQALNELFATQVSPDRVAAIIIEAVQGDGGFLSAPVEFLRALRALTEQHGIVLILDEVQTGFGRTGTWFGFQHAGIQPDLVTVAKSLAAGMPISGVVGRAEIMDAPAPGGLGGTYGGNALACAAALAVIDTYQQEQLLARGDKLGERLRQGLLRLQARNPQQIGDVRGTGLMLAIELVKDDAARSPDPELNQKLIDEARNGGLLVIKCGVYRNVLRFLAPLVAEEAQIDEALEILEAALARVLS